MGIDPKVLEKAARTVKTAFSVECVLYDSHKPLLLNNTLCSECAKLQQKYFGELKCSSLHSYGVYQSGKWGGKYEYFCNIGLAFISAAIPVNSEMNYALLFGPFLMIKGQELISDDLKRLFGSRDTKKLERHIRTAPYIPSFQVTPIADILGMIAVQNAVILKSSEQLGKEVTEANNNFYELMYKRKDLSKIAELQLELEKKLISCIKNNERELAQKLLNDILGSIYFSSAGELDTIKVRITELVVMLLREGTSAGAAPEEIFALSGDYMREIQSLTDMESLNVWLSNVISTVMKSFFSRGDVKHFSSVKRIHQYVSTNYMNKISLNELSDIAGLSVSYLSKIYKEEMGESLSGYINRVRIENAKELLKNGDIALIDIAYLVGFEDQSYFSKVFKRVEGISPGKYRERCLK